MSGIGLPELNDARPVHNLRNLMRSVLGKQSFQEGPHSCLMPRPPCNSISGTEEEP